MRAGDYGLSLAFVALFTFLYGMVDLKPEAGSYLFLKSFSYAMYLSFRAALGLVAVFIMVQADVSLPLFAMGLLGALSSLTVLQSLSFSAGGDKLATLEPLLTPYSSTALCGETKEERSTRII